MHTKHTDMDTHLQAFFKKLLHLPDLIIQSSTPERSHKDLDNFRKKREDCCSVRITKFLLQMPLIIKPLGFFLYLSI